MQLIDFSCYDFQSEEACKTIQLSLANQICLKPSIQINQIQTVAGVDLAYWTEDQQEKAVCCIVVLDFSSGTVLERVHQVGTIHFPYLPGYLSFRELPLILDTVKKLTLGPDVYLFDGNGYLHPRHMGIATHASFYLKTPTIGVAKTYYKIKEVDYQLPEDKPYAYQDIIIEEEIYGRVLRTRQGVKPIFLSVGNDLDLDTSTEIVKHLINKESRIPLPTRLADLDTHEQRRIYQQLSIV